MKKLLFVILPVILIFSACQLDPGELDMTPDVPDTPNVQESITADHDDPVDPFGAGDMVSEYLGTFFSVSYPAAFAIESEATDYVSFESADGKVAFAVYAPQWTGDGAPIITQANEIETDRSENTSVVAESELGTDAEKSIVYVTVKADDGSYWRSMVTETLTKDSSTMKIFSVRYENQESYDEYLDAYLTFKSSLQQFAD